MIDTIPRTALQQHIAVLGKTGSGKTYAVRGVVEQILDRKERVCIVDPTGAWHGLRSSATGKSVGLPVVIFGGAHADLPLSGTHGEAIAETIGTTSTPAIIDTSLMRVGERTRFFADFADALVRKNKGPLHLVIDEAHLFAPQGKVNDPQSGAMLHAANELVSRGRSRGLSVVLITQRPAKLHKDSLTQVETLIAMRLIAPQDRKAVEEWIKDNADQAKGREILASLATLKTGQGWIWAPELNLLERISFPKIKTFDSGRAPDGSETVGQVLAPIDREAIAEKLKDLAADALANDPAALKRDLAAAKRELALAKNAKAGTSDDELRATVKAAEQRGIESGAKAWRDKLFNIGCRAIEASERIRGLVADLKEIEGLCNSNPAFIPIKTPVLTREKPAPVMLTPKRYDRPAPKASDGAAVSGLQLKILNALAWLEANGISRPSRQTLGAAAGVSPSSSYFENTLGAMRTAALIQYPAPGLVEATHEGRTLGDPGDTSGEVSDRWLSILKGLEREIVSSLIEVHPKEVSRDELAGMLGKSASSSYFENTLGRLRTLGVINYPRPGFVQLTKYVMP